MSRAKAFISILMVLILIALSGVSVWAAPGRQEPTEEPTVISGEIEGIAIEVDEETGTTTVLVTLTDELGETQTVRLSLETATALGLAGQDEEGNPIVNEDMIGKTIEIDPADVIEDGDEEALHPVASAMAEFFADTLGLDYDTIMSYHEDGMGFGVIAKACWMSIALEGDASLVGDILAAKKSGDFSFITLPDGTTPKNWGQFKKAVLGSEKVQKNLGTIMSGRAEGEQETESTANQDQGEGKKGKGSGEEEGGSPTESPDKGKGKGSESGGPPTEPPGKSGDKDKGGKGKGKS